MTGRALQFDRGLVRVGKLQDRLRLHPVRSGVIDVYSCARVLRAMRSPSSSSQSMGAAWPAACS